MGKQAAKKTPRIDNAQARVGKIIADAQAEADKIKADALEAAESFPDNAKISVGHTKGFLPPNGSESVLNVKGKQIVVKRTKPMPT